MEVQILGLVVGGLIAFASLPQLWKIIKSKNTRDISLQTYILLNIGTFLWLLFGFLTHEPAVIITNFIFQLFNLTILFFKIKYG